MRLTPGTAYTFQLQVRRGRRRRRQQQQGSRAAWQQPAHPPARACARQLPCAPFPAACSHPRPPSGRRPSLAGIQHPGSQPLEPRGQLSHPGLRASAARATRPGGGQQGGQARRRPSAPPPPHTITCTPFPAQRVQHPGASLQQGRRPQPQALPGGGGKLAPAFLSPGLAPQRRRRLPAPLQDAVTLAWAEPAHNGAPITRYILEVSCPPSQRRALRGAQPPPPTPALHSAPPPPPPPPPPLRPAPPPPTCRAMTAAAASSTSCTAAWSAVPSSPTWPAGCPTASGCAQTTA
jgi:hypothetical protein